ncbi:hypothetical protein FNV43_RR25853 [Rhamnella rubrinervis]|uniref:TPX2 C-terminal domain-containing protein n=1 Tax=Rhamnella rubrinervis TaxID=2594499 RepID=A0A8K0DLI5_9ROSA|nr:hypothetical protein FNV43_RR25853 [Rhamnella rubrinervis]
MGESACLVRSFSHPSESSREAKQGDPFRALGESISFGRFMTEPLAWEKWSAFSHNRYLEEVEKFSKPGSVAQKKAYFEAHYKRKAAERAAAVLETVNAVTSNVSESVMDKNSEDSSPDSCVVKGENHRDEQLEKDDPVEVVYSANMIESSSSADRNESDFAKVEEEEVVTQEGIDLENSNRVQICNQSVSKEDHRNIVANVEEKIPNHGLDVTHIEAADICFENSNKVEVSNQFVNKEDHHKIVANIEEKILNKENASQEIENLALTSKKRLTNSSSKLLTQSRPSKVFLSSAKQDTCVQMRNGNVVAPPRSKKPVENSDVKKKLSEKSLHKSIHFSSHFVESNMTTSSAIQKFGNSRVSTSSLNMSKNSSSSLKTITRFQASVNRVLKRPSVDLKTEDRRIKPLLSKSVAGGMTTDQKWNSLSTHHSKSPSGNGSKIRSSMIFSPFSFRSEERAAKRKEYFQKLEEKRIAEDAENKHLETRSQEKTVQDVKKMRHNTGLKARQDEDLCSGPQFPSNQMKKIPLTRPRSPKLGRKSTSSRVMDSSRPSPNTKSPKCVVEKNKQNSNKSVTSRSQKNAHENASPNIQS